MTRWIKKRRTIPEARAALKARYAEQVERFQSLRDTGEARYVAVNLISAQTYCVQEMQP